MARTGRPKAELVLTDAEREQLLQWSRRRKSAQALALRSRIVLACAVPGAMNKQVAADLGLSPHTGHKWRRWFVAKVVDVVGLYHNPPERAVVVLCVDEKSQMQALNRSQPVMPMMPGMPERRSHDYARHGVTSLFAAFNVADGTVISEIHRK